MTTIKETIEQIKNNLDFSYQKLQELEYEKEIENYIRIELLNIIVITKSLLEFAYSQQAKQNQNKKRQGNKR